MNRQRINFEEIRQGFQGKPFCKLVKHHLDSLKQDTRILGIKGTFEMLPEEAKPLVEPFIDRWNIKAYEKDFWQMDTATVFDGIIDDSKSVFSEYGIQFDDETLFNMFNIIVLSYAYSAYDQPKMKKFMGIHSSKFPWMSSISLFYPVLATIDIYTNTPANISMVVGYGFANLGYVMFMAGAFTGTFRVFGIIKRWHVFVVALISFLIGAILSNIVV